MCAASGILSCKGFRVWQVRVEVRDYYNLHHREPQTPRILLSRVFGVVWGGVQELAPVIITCNVVTMSPSSRTCSLMIWTHATVQRASALRISSSSGGMDARHCIHSAPFAHRSHHSVAHADEVWAALCVLMRQPSTIGRPLRVFVPVCSNTAVLTS